jgi:dTDP-4-dehydrorhamnose 3,5-epimerase
MAFQFQRLEIPEVIMVQATVARDDRGSFRESYKQSVFAANGITETFVQDNSSLSTQGVLRGLHFQKEPRAQGKLVTVSQGEVFDVAVDIRKGSPTYGKWLGMRLSAENGCMLYIPAGFAHGFCALSDIAAVMYKVTAEYAPELDRGVAWNDPEVGVVWPIAEPCLSPKDANLPVLRLADNNFEFGRNRS